MAYPHVVFNSMGKDIGSAISIAMLIEAVLAERTEPIVGRRRLKMPVVVHQKATEERR